MDYPDNQWEAIQIAIAVEIAAKGE